MKASVFIATSMDGFIAREDGALDWLPGDDCEEHGYDAFVASVDAIIIGRNTFEKVLGFGGWAYGAKPVVVLTSGRLKQPPPPGAVLDVMGGSPHDIAARLTEGGVQHAYVDGGITVQRFLEAGLIQRMIVTRIPVLLGRGIPLFGALSHDVRLNHVATRTFASGMVQSEYRIGDSSNLPAT